VSISVPNTMAMLELYGVTGADRDAIVELARTARLPGLPRTDDYLRAMAEGELAPCTREKLDRLIRRVLTQGDVARICHG